MRWLIAFLWVLPIVDSLQLHGDWRVRPEESQSYWHVPAAIGPRGRNIDRNPMVNENSERSYVYTVPTTA
jgi:hypothetical protein